ncbi:transcription factor-like protein DPB [Oryza brachyantha]|uniref:transcription factor-like protein DPB n=1 Tax=Oryza brachyantha TaxID=4533 RepID=UPI001ADBFADE|nr:transcription factor-like protein DPB [Oryza brachyantha]
MVSGVAHLPDDDGGRGTSTFQRPPQPAGARPFLATPPPSSGAQSASTSGGSAGSPSSRSEQHVPAAAGMAEAPAAAAGAATSTPASENTFLRLNDLDIHGDDAPSSQAPTSKKKKRGARAVGPDKGGRGLRQFSMKVCEKVESKGRTTYNEVADELVAEFADPNNSILPPDPDNPNAQQYDEKNIRRRVYDALNVLMAMEIISKDKKEIQWKGLPRTSINDIEDLQTELLGLKSRIEKKNAYLQELQDQFVGMQKLIQRNERLYGSGNIPSGGVALPFILVQTRPHATVEVEISEDMQLVHFDFNSTPFELHDDSYVLKAMSSCGEQNDGIHDLIPNGGESSSMPNIYRQQMQQPARATNGTARLPSSPPIPGILKGRVKHEH